MSGGASGVARLDHALEGPDLGHDPPAIRPIDERELIDDDAVEQLDIAGVECTIDRSGKFNEGLADLLRRRSVFTSEQEVR